MEYIKGKYKSAIFTSESGYMVGLFRVKEANEENADIVNKTVTFTGYFPELNNEDLYIFYGKYVFHERYGYQFQVTSYERVEPEGEDAIIDFLTSSFVKGCGEKTAKKIVAVLGDNAISLIKEDKENLVRCGLTPTQVEKIYKSIMSYYNSDELIIYLKGLDFSVKEITRIISLYGSAAKKIVETNLYSLVDFIDFNKLDKIFFRIYEDTNEMRILACIIETCKRLTFESGDTYSYKEEIIAYLNATFKINLFDNFEEYVEKLKYQGELKVLGKKYYLMKYYQDEKYISKTLFEMNENLNKPVNNLNHFLSLVEEEFNIEYNEEQKNAIKRVLSTSITIITGGPGTGKTTLINGLLRMYQYINNLTDLQMNHKVALLAPTGRASKRMSETTNYGASTIHRYLKWNHELKEFGVNELNPQEHELIIVDEVSMIDTELMASLLRGIQHDCKLVLVGDEFQLPSVGPGNVLKDLIATDVFNHIRLNNIYRQSENSFIPILASEIKSVNVTSDILTKKDDYNFLPCPKDKVKHTLKEIISKCLKKGLTEKDMQILAPMYKGENGIDNLNIILQNLFNPYSDLLEEVHIGPVIYRVNDKVINLVNDMEQNIFNGDIGYIREFNTKKSSEFMKVDFYGNLVTIKRENVSQIKHAYAMSIHKSQGSEFNHVIIPMTKEFNRMLYNKLIYTGISRAKKSLVLIGDSEAFHYAVNNSYSVERKTSLTEFIMNNYQE
ncbi:MAG: ATP-dependent RecD-like DNA helicase [Bacilli bacterium]|nr:ATP-dependent RecD-like DNA helicase [Bacilli bacterium]